MIITDERIRKVEKLLLDGKSFNDEQKEFIHCNNTSLNLVACPGSGKTTSLLAKLILLSDEMSFKNNRGICVLTHTNVAIDMIKQKLGSKSNILFSYPNFFGTIQSFVDLFLFIPFWTIYNKVRPIKIDNDAYEESIVKRKSFKNFPQGFDDQTVKNKYHYLMINDKFIYDYRLRFINNEVQVWNPILGKKVEFKPRSKMGWSEEEKRNLEQWFIKYKCITHIIDNVFSFYDAYFFAAIYLKQYPFIIPSIQKRFKYVFIDEMQDTDFHQKEILDKIFPSESSDYIIQYIGDPNQAIFSNYTDTKISIWNPDRNSDKTKILSNSLRFGEEIAKRIKFVCINNISHSLKGSVNVISKIPHLILYENATPKENVLKKFAELISIYDIKPDKSRPFKAVGSVGKEKENDKITLKSYFREFCNKSLFEKTSYGNAISYLKKPKSELVIKKGVKVYSEIFFNLVLRLLELEELKLNRNGREYYFTKPSLLNYLLETNEEFYKELLIKVSEWSILLHKSNDYDQSLLGNFSKFIKEKFTLVMGLDYSKIQNFLEDMSIDPIMYNIFKYNIFTSQEYPGIEIEIATIHSIKGETHKATLYLDTVFYELDSHHIKEQFIGNIYTFRENHDARKKRTLKLAHVAMSRPTDLLCFACNKSTFTEKELNRINYNNNSDFGWIITYC